MACSSVADGDSKDADQPPPVIEENWRLTRYMGDWLPYQTEGETQYGPLTIPYVVTITAGSIAVSEEREGLFSIEQDAFINDEQHDISFDGPVDIVETDVLQYEMTVRPDVVDDNGQPMEPFLLTCDLSVNALHCTGEGVEDWPDWDMRYVVDL